VTTGATGAVVVPFTPLPGTDPTTDDTGTGVVCPSGLSGEPPAGAGALGDGAAFVGPDVAGLLDAGTLGASSVLEGPGMPGEPVSIGQTVVKVVIVVVTEPAGQFVIAGAPDVRTVEVVNMVRMDVTMTGLLDTGTLGAAVSIGRIVVKVIIVVVTEPMGQLVTAGGQDVMVKTDVVVTVEVVDAGTLGASSVIAGAPDVIIETDVVRTVEVVNMVRMDVTMTGLLDAGTLGAAVSIGRIVVKVIVVVVTEPMGQLVTAGGQDVMVKTDVVVTVEMVDPAGMDVVNAGFV